MSDLQTQINHRIETFIADITALARQQALETLQSALGGVSARGRAVARAGALGSGIAPRSTSRKKGEKRSAGEIGRTVEVLASHIGQQPGSRIEQIARALDIATKEMVLPIRKLLADGRIRAEGQRRATKYFPADGAGPARRRGKKARK